jgi:outer membrane receptor protein involved in Fe transport
MKLPYLICCVCVWLTTAAVAQTTLTGSIRDEAGKPLPFASIALLTARDSSLVKGTISKETGIYEFDNVQPGQYRLSASAMGYASVRSQTVSVGTTAAKLPILTLSPATKTLGEVTVTAQKPLFEQQIDRMVINVQSSITSAGSTALDILERSPGVVVDRQNNILSMNGKQGVMVMLNGHLTRLPLDAVMQMLSGMQAGTIEKIELITSPPAKYDAEGNAGLINIVTKRNINLGSNGSYSVNFGYGRYERTGASANVNHKTEKLSLYADYSAMRNHYLLLANTERTITQAPPQQTLVIVNRDYIDWTHNGRVGVDYQLSPKTTLSGLATAFSYRSSQLAHNTSATTKEGKPITNITIQDKELNHSWIYTGNMSARHKLTPTQELSADVDYIYYFNNNPHEYQFQYDYPQEARQSTEWLNNTKQTPVQLWVARSDYTRAFGQKTNLELGAKATFSHFDNNIQAVRQTNGEWIKDLSLSQHVLMNETIKAAYVNLTRQFSPKTKVQAGLRYEHTITDLRTFDNQPLVYRNYGNWFPTAFFSQDFTKQSGIQLSYSRRINRPSFGNLAPFFTFVDPNWSLGGNDRLLPTISDNFQTTYRFRKSFLLTLSYAQFNNAIVFMSTVIPDQNRQITRPENLDRLTVSSIALNFPLQLTPWWQMQTNVQGISQQSRLILEGVALDRSQQFFRVNTTQTIKLPHDFTAEITAFYQSRALQGVTERKPFGSLNIGVQKRLRNDAGTLRLTGEDILWTQRIQTYFNNVEQGYTVSFDQRLTNRLLRLTYTRNFGNQKVKVAKPTIKSEEERQRVGN